MNENKAERLTAKLGALETVRGVGAVVVLLHHISLAFLPFAYLGSVAPPHFGWETLLHRTPLGLLIAGRFAIAVFFVLSGFVLSLVFLGPHPKSEQELAAATVKRIFRLAPMVALGVMLPVMLARLGLTFHHTASEITGSTTWLGHELSGNLSLTAVARALGLNLFSNSQFYNSALWTIELELQGSFVVYLILFVFRHSRWRWGGYAVLAFWWRKDLLLTFLAGLVLADAFASWPGLRRWCAPVWILLPGLAVAFWLGGFPQGLVLSGQPVEGPWYGFLPKNPYGRDGWLVVGAVLLIALCLGNPRLMRMLDCAPGRFLGRISYALYATHIPVLLSVGAGLVVWLSPQIDDYAVVAFVATLATVVVAVAVAKLFTLAVDGPSVQLANWIGAMFKASMNKPKLMARPTEIEQDARL
jgi:peptidoglycan/LPS O-acetylase OafA/YrhL